MISTAMIAAMTWVVTRRRGEVGAACALGKPAVTEVPDAPEVPEEAVGVAAAASGAGGVGAAGGVVDGPEQAQLLDRSCIIQPVETPLYQPA